MLEKKMHLAGHWLTRTGRTRYSKNMNIVFFKKNLDFNQTTLNKQGSIHKNTSYK